MTTSPLSRNAPLWVLLAGSFVSAAIGGFVLTSRLITMDARLQDGTATTSDVYVGQTWAGFGAVLVGAGIVGLALALTVAALRPHASTADPRVSDTDSRGGDLDLVEDENAEPVSVEAGEEIVAESDLSSEEDAVPALDDPEASSATTPIEAEPAPVR